MNLKKSSLTEKILIVILVVVIVFYLYWLNILNPLLLSIDKTNGDIIKVEALLEKTRNQKVSNPSGQGSIEDEIKLYPREEQLSKVVGLIDSGFKKYGIKLLTLHQSSKDQFLVIDVVCYGGHQELLSFLRSFDDLDTFVVIDSASLVPRKSKLEISISFLTGYKNNGEESK